MKNQRTELIFILDRSGSMSGLESDTIGGFNAMLEKQKKEAGECRITTVLFDSQYELLHDRVDIDKVQPITEKDYFVRGSTALLDAMGKTMHKIERVQQCEPSRVLMVIITDGEENSSREYQLETIKMKVKFLKEKSWEFIFLGANMDAVTTAGHMGIDPHHAVDYVADSEGTELNFKVMSDAVSNFRRSGFVPPESLEEIRCDVEKRRG